MYIVIHVTRSGDTVAKEIFDFPTLKAAKANHFYFLSSAYSNENLDYFMSEIVDEGGSAVCSERYYRPTVSEEE